MKLLSRLRARKRDNIIGTVDVQLPDDGINALDLAFVVDTTGSMGGLIAAAQRQMLAMIERISKSADVHLRLALVEYRDHPPQDSSLIARVYPFTGDRARMQAAIDGLKADGGGDGPEAVFDGLMAAVNDLAWRINARRLVVLIGDAPPHGVGAAGDGFHDGCPCGSTLESVTAAAEQARITVYGLGLTASVATSFAVLSQATGGDYFRAGHGEVAIERMEAILQREFGDLAFDRQVLALRRAQPDLDLDELALELVSSRPAVATSLSRLGSRGLLTS